MFRLTPSLFPSPISFAGKKNTTGGQRFLLVKWRHADTGLQMLVDPSQQRDLEILVQAAA